MKRTILVLAFPLLLGGCAQLFDANVFGTIDLPPPLNTSNLKKATPEDIKNMLKDESFVEQLKEDPVALAAAQEALNNTINSATATDEDKLAAAATMIELTTDGSGVADLKADAIENAPTIASAIADGEYALALKLFMGDQTEAEIKATLGNLSIMATTLATMQDLSTDGNGLVDSDTFFSAASDEGAFALSALMAAIAKALIEDSTGTTLTDRVANLATNLAGASPTTPSGLSADDMAAFLAAKDTDEPEAFTVTDGRCVASGYSYAYVTVILPKLIAVL